MPQPTRTFAVFHDHPTKGLVHQTDLCGETLQECVEKVTKYEHQTTMFHIYMLREENFPLNDTRFHIYNHRLSSAGSKASAWTTLLAYEYALTHKSSNAWMFSNDVFGYQQC